ncbi:Crp/Fnr family transcriptional regulator [Leisingera caerulea]|uniref:Crp/Fnr family transcriptional regulator n=1 Tax=Leisingera caerulea TaxID=506591 RepID=UPI0009FFB58E|nr:Crp/Fnr family transcriptional regulator [Leisingera caerulea]
MPQHVNIQPQGCHWPSDKRHRRFSDGETVILKGREMPFVATIVQGHACIKSSLQDGRSQIVGLLFPSDVLGSPGRRQASHTVVAVGPVELCCLCVKDFEHFSDQEPELARHLLERKFEELERARKWMVLLGRKTARERVASYLVLLTRRRRQMADRLQNLNFPELDLLLKRHQIANFLGLSAATISRQLHQLQEEGVLEILRSQYVLIKDYQALFSMTGDDSDGGIIS